MTDNKILYKDKSVSELSKDEIVEAAEFARSKPMYDPAAWVNVSKFDFVQELKTAARLAGVDLNNIERVGLI